MPSQKIHQVEKSFITIYKAELVLLFVTITWGLSFPLTKTALEFTSPGFLTFIRFFLTILIFYSIYKRKLDFKQNHQWKYGFTLGIFLFFGFALQTAGMKFTSASKSAFITGTALIIIPFAQYFILKNKPKVENIAGAIIVLAGLYILSESYFTVPNIGDILTLLCAVSFAIHIVLLDKYSRIVNLDLLIFGQFLAMVIFSSAFIIVWEVNIYDEFFFTMNSKLVISVLFITIFSSLIGIVLMTKYQRKTTPLRAGIIYNMESIFAVFFSFILIGEFLNFSQFLGAVIMLAGLFISEFYGFIKLKLQSEHWRKD